MPFERTIAPFGSSRSGWNRAPFVPWTQCTGHAPPNSLKCFVSRGCQSRVKIMGRPRRPNRPTVRFTRGMIASPSGTPRAPPGQKSRSLKACARLDLLEVFEVIVPERHVPRQGVEPSCLDHLVVRLEIRGSRPDDELGEVAMAGPVSVRHCLVDQAARGPERRPGSSAECGIIRWSDAGPTDDGDPTEPVEGVPHPVLALSGTHRCFLG